MSITRNHLEAQTLKATPLTRNQVRGFWASWGGWTLDGMDSFIYALVLVPSLRELLPRSGIAATKGNVGYYGGLLFALFLCGWGLAFLWGPVGDKFGRVRTLMLTIVWYSVFTFLSALVTNVWQLAVLRRRSSGHSSATKVPPIARSPPMPIPASRRNTGSCQTFVTSALRKVNTEYQTMVSMSVN